MKAFLQETEAACGNSWNVVERVMARHRDVQSGKFDKGRRKMPWLEYVQNERIALTTTRVGGLGHEVKEHKKITPHPYRLNSADALYNASRLR